MKLISLAEQEQTSGVCGWLKKTSWVCHWITPLATPGRRQPCLFEVAVSLESFAQSPINRIQHKNTKWLDPIMAISSFARMPSIIKNTNGPGSPESVASVDLPSMNGSFPFILISNLTSSCGFLHCPIWSQAVGGGIALQHDCLSVIEARGIVRPLTRNDCGRCVLSRSWRRRPEDRQGLPPKPSPSQHQSPTI